MDSSNQPLAAAQIQAIVSRDFFRTFETVEIRTSPEGTCTLPSTGDAWIVLNVWAKGRSPRVVARTGGDVGEWTIRLSPAAAFAGRLTRPADRPVGGIRLRFEPLICQAGFVEKIASTLPILDEEVVTDLRGDFLCHTLRLGDYKVRMADEPRAPAIILQEAEVRAGSATLRAMWEL